MDQPRWPVLGYADGGDFELSLDPAVGLLLCDVEGCIFRVNRALCDIVARSEPDVVGRRHTDLLHPADWTVEESTVAVLMTGKSTRHRVEARYLRPDGDVRWVTITASLLRNQSSGEHSAPLTMRRVLDITDRRRIEAERDRFFNHSPAGIMVFGYDGKFERVNRAVADMLGWSEDELVGRPFTNLAHPDDRAMMLETAARLVAEGTPIEYEGRARTRAGEYRWIRSTAIAVPDERLVYSWNIDIDERKQAEAMLRESEERFRRMFEESPAGGAFVDPSLRLLKVNSALTRMLDRPAPTLKGANLAELIHPEDVAVLSHLSRRALEGAIPGYETEARLSHRDGSDVWAAIRASVVRDASGRALYLLQIIEDISDAREAENAHRDIDQLKNQFLRVVSHDIQNPLLTIAQLADLAIREQCHLDLHQEAVRRIAAQAACLQRMVTHCLDLERLYHGSVNTARRATDIAALVSHVIERCDRRDHPLAVDVGPLVAEVDPDQVEHILENLLENAFCHTPPDTPVWVRIEGAAGTLDITVEDAGPGVPDDHKESVFELFRTGGGAVARTGVGLWVVARYAELHGGRAWVEDRSGGGASFRVVLQVSASAQRIATNLS